MKLSSVAHLLSWSLLAKTALGQANFQLVSQYLGAATPTLNNNDPTVSTYFKICTNYAHAYQNVAALPTALASQIRQLQADGTCNHCVGWGLSRVDSCCAAATSVACFDQYAGPAGATAGQVTPTASAPTAAETGATGSNRSASGGDRTGAVSFVEDNVSLR